MLNTDEIMKILPHRPPFLLVDRITEMEPGVSAKGVKCVSMNEPQFQGHFPGYPVMPGVLIIEAMAQTGAVALLSEEKFRGKTVFFGGIRACRFRREVRPGDVMDLSCEITALRGPMGFGKARAEVDGELACEAELSFVIK
ncbi:MAG: 3-hydroxyacyl-ACP dehydratase FabZ [Anaerovoracaceae bacterium]|jgi:3-hydroxyacyl-[acyl-carrier-protein] dehydratase